MANNPKKYAGESTLSALVTKIKELFVSKTDFNSSLSNKADKSHTHSISDTTNLQSTLDGKVPTSRTINNKPLTANVTLSASDVGAASSTHSHDDRYYTETEIDSKLSGKSDTTHNHDSKYDTKGAAAAVQENLDTISDTLDDHTGNSDIHFTAAERTKLSGIAAGAQVNTITGVKGNSESSYRTGNVNITKANIGLGNVDNTSDANKPISTAQQLAFDEVNDAIDTHTENDDIHVTTTNKTNWNAAHTHSTSAHARTDATKVEDSSTNGNIKINGTETNVYSHPNSGVTAGTYKSVTVNAQGHVTGGSNPTTLSGFGITDGALKSDVTNHNTSTSAHGDIRELITGLTTRLNTLANSDDTTLDQMSEIVAYIKSNKSLIDSVTTNKVNVADIVNNLTTNVTNKPLSAAQGVAIKALINDLQAELDGHTHTVANITDLTVSASELNRMDGITENIQLQFDRITDAKADWSQNDETAINYVKNRTHWIDDPVSTEIFAERTIEFTDTYVEDTMGTMLVEGCTYVVTWDGVQYECLARNDGYDDIYIGNQSLSNGWSFPEDIVSSEPFFIATYEPDNWSVIRVSKTGIYAVKIIGMISEVHEISEKFIPKSIARAEDLIGKNGTNANAEIFNDYSNNVASGEYSHAEGYKTTASEMYAHSEGNQSVASGHASHAEGAYNEASGWISHAEGFSTIAASDRQHVQGANNIVDTEGKYLHIVGNGSRTSVDTDRSNAHTLDWDGNAWFAGDIFVGGTSQDDTSASKVITKADQRWNLIYDSGEISAIANSISNIDVSGYTNIQVLVRIYNDGDSVGSRAGSAIFKCANGKNYQFPVWANMFSKSINTVYVMATFNLVDGWLICPCASRLIGDATTFEDTEGGTAGSLAPTGSGMMKCTSPLSTLTISSLDQNSNYYFGMGSRVMVWGWNA